MQPKMDMNKLMEFIRSQGRYGDTVLAHINPEEASLLKKAGGSGTINPRTGLPEFSWISDLGNFISSIPIVGNVTDALDKGLYDVLDTGGNLLGLNKKGNLLGMNVDEFKDKLLHPAGIAAATYGIGSALSAPVTEAIPAATAVGEASTAGTLLDPLMGAAAEGGAATVAPATGTVPLATMTPVQAAGLAGAGTGAQYASLYPEFAGPAATGAVAGGLASELATPSQPTGPFLANPEPGSVYQPPQTFDPAQSVSGYDLSNPGINFSAPNTDGGTMNNTWDWITNSVSNNPKTSAFAGLMAANLLSSGLQSSMIKGTNEAQQQSYQDYLSALNPPAAVKDTRFATLAENARTQGNIAQKRVADSLASRGIAGKGMVAPTGDLEQAKKDAINAAWNQIYGTYNVPGSPGPVNYSPSTGQLAGSNLAQMTAQGIPLALLMSKYGVTS